MNKGDDKYDIKVPNHTSLYLSGKTNINAAMLDWRFIIIYIYNTSIVCWIVSSIFMNRDAKGWVKHVVRGSSSNFSTCFGNSSILGFTLHEYTAPKCDAALFGGGLCKWHKSNSLQWVWEVGWVWVQGLTYASSSLENITLCHERRWSDQREQQNDAHVPAFPLSVIYRVWDWALLTHCACVWIVAPAWLNELFP